MSKQLSANAVAMAAGLSESWAWKARDQGILYEPHFEDAVVALRVYAFVSQIVWPGNRRPRSARQDLELWQSTAVEAARQAVYDPNTTPDTALWVLEDSVHLVTTPAERAAFDLEHLNSRVAIRIPVGLWVAELPDAIAGTPNRRRRRPTAPKPAA
ncbi:hypothetical protein ABT160_16565 [Streptomyces sp. NPDC001941]|uniref:hypothetical protein n=1 Tax=Streptomyces sp. NPDC001941 TaxID=3154659 RepID=UPI0033173911